MLNLFLDFLPVAGPKIDALEKVVWMSNQFNSYTIRLGHNLLATDSVFVEFDEVELEVFLLLWKVQVPFRVRVFG